VKVCTDDKGTVISTETVVEIQGGGGGKPHPKLTGPNSGAGGNEAITQRSRELNGSRR